MNGELFIQDLQSFVKDGKRADGTDYVYGMLDDLLLSGKMEEVSKILSTVVKRISSLKEFPFSYFLSMITITRPWREDLGQVSKDLQDAVKTLALTKYSEEYIEEHFSWYFDMK